MSPSDHQHCILLVDDDVDLVEALRWMLEGDGFDVAVASSGAEALALLAEGLRPCLMLLDIWMPEVDGWDVVARMREEPEWSAIPVVIMSGSSDVDRGQQAGVAGTLAKPASHDELTSTVAKHLRCPLPSKAPSR